MADNSQIFSNSLFLMNLIQISVRLVSNGPVVSNCVHTMACHPFLRTRWHQLVDVPVYMHQQTPHIAKTFGSMLIRCRSKAKVSDRYLIDVDSGVFVFWDNDDYKIKCIHLKVTLVINNSKFNHYQSLKYRHWPQKISNTRQLWNKFILIPSLRRGHICGYE